MQERTAEQKIREQLAGSPYSEPHFEHEGDQVVRWITGGSLPDAYVTFQHEAEWIIVHCAHCQTMLGQFPADYEADETTRALMEVRLSGHEHHTPVEG